MRIKLFTVLLVVAVAFAVVVTVVVEAGTTHEQAALTTALGNIAKAGGLYSLPVSLGGVQSGLASRFLAGLAVAVLVTVL